MLKNLQAEMVRHGVSKTDIADALECTYQTAHLKISGASRFTFDEAVTVRDKFFSGLDLEYLFLSREEVS